MGATVLAGDVGATKTRLALYDIENGAKSFALRAQAQFDSRSSQSLAQIIELFLAQTSASICSACFGVPGPVVEGKAKITNLPWELDQTLLAQELKIKSVSLVNDLVATASAVPGLQAADILQLNQASRVALPRNYVVLAPGTGLGQSFLFLNYDGSYTAFPSEGGHVDFAPTSELQWELYKYLKQTHGLSRVSVERVVSGLGLVNIYNFLRETGKFSESEEFRSLRAETDLGSLITEFAGSNRFPICVAVLDLFIELLGVVAGNLALTYLPEGGIYLAGGILPRIVDRMRDGALLAAYESKGRLSGVVKGVPLLLVLDDQLALRGNALIASRALQGRS